MESSDFDVEQFRKRHESNIEWQAKRNFILAYKDRLTLDRLLCLASCYISNEFYGNVYPAPVMQQLQELKLDLPKIKNVSSGSNKITNIQKRSHVAFVKSSDKNDNEIIPVKKAKVTTDSQNVEEIEQKFCELVIPVKKAKVTTNSPNVEEIEQKFCKLVEFLSCNEHGNPSVILSNACNKARMCLAASFVQNSQTKFKCDLSIDSIQVAKGSGTQKKTAKRCASEKAIHLLKKPYLKVTFEKDQKVLISSKIPFIDKHGDSSLDSIKISTGIASKKKKASEEAINLLKKPYPMVNFEKDQKVFSSSVPLIDEQKEVSSETQLSKKVTLRSLEQKYPGFKKYFSQFIIIMGTNHENMLQILNNSAAVNKCSLVWNITDSVGGFVRCECVIEDYSVVTVAALRADAKVAAATEVIELFKQICWTIRSKQKIDQTGDSEITLDNLIGKLESDIINTKLSDNNVGRKMMLKMGWAGGGLGKEGNEGIIEPINPAGTERRRGLGADADVKISKGYLSKVFSDYINSDNQQDLVFSPGLSREERAMVHVEVRKLGLKSQSHGKGNERYLVVSRKRSVYQLFDYINENGGETNKYLLVPPQFS